MDFSPIADIKPSDEIRFWAKVHRDNEPACWEWRAHKNSFGYGKFFLNGMIVYAHRFACALRGDDITRKIVMHTCDNPSCVNPRHLVAATQKENVVDMFDKGREGRFRGGAYCSASVSAEKIAGMRKAYRDNGSIRETARLFDVSYDIARQSIRGVTWARAVCGEPPVELGATRRANIGARALTDTQAASIKRSLLAGCSRAEIRTAHGISKTLLSDISTGKAYQWISV
ncbi:HNH endonuclease [Paracandidimonas lactea]|uniref:HNH endonuclease n=1 Tax=Paracandidimonas lactea TaxID=2895524 RepID=UPI001F177C88|nr:HNH endonuclease [Paracandidimonas lactea]